jgi:hypothetical protein
VTITLPRPPLGLVISLVAVPQAVLVVGPQTVLVLRLDLHGFRALSDKVHVLHALVAHARAPPSVLPVHVHALEPPT